VTEEFSNFVRVKLINGASQGITKARSFMQRLGQTCVCFKDAGFQNFVICTGELFFYQTLI
jgi:hypothetical protein